MNYAQKQLDKVLDRLQKARATKCALKHMARAIRQEKPVALMFQVPGVAPLLLSSADIGTERSLGLVKMLLNSTQADINHLKQHQLHCCEVVLLLAQQKQKNQPATTEAGVTKVLQMEQPPAVGAAV